MSSTRPPELGDDPASLTELWSALEPTTGHTRPLIRAVMITSIDGTATIDGRSGGLGTPTDRLVYGAARARADVVLVGATTALEEGYGPATVDQEWRDRRTGPPPAVLLLTRTLTDPVVDHCARYPRGLQIAVGAEVDAVRLAAARERGVAVHVLEPGPLGVAVRGLLTRLGADEVALEGGPRLLGSLLAEGAVDELVLSIAPEVIAGGDPTRLVHSGGRRPYRTPMRVAAAFSGPDGGLYTRWTVDRPVR